MKNDLNGYDLSRKWFDFSFENPEKIRPIHTAIFLFAVEHCNRLGWKEKFGLPSQMVMEVIGVSSYNTYIKAFRDLVDWGFIKLIQKSKNQYNSNIIALSNNNKALDKALDKALIKHASKHSESTDSINKQTNNEQLNNEQGTILSLVSSDDGYSFDDFWNDYDKKLDRAKCEPKWKKISNSDKELIREFIPIYKTYEPDKNYRKNPMTFLTAKTWEDDWNDYPPKQKTNSNADNTKQSRIDRDIEFIRELQGS